MSSKHCDNCRRGCLAKLQEQLADHQDVTMLRLIETVVTIKSSSRAKQIFFSLMLLILVMQD